MAIKHFTILYFNCTNNNAYCIYNRMRISSNCVQLIFGKGHLSTLEASRDTVLVLLSAKRFDPGGSSSVIL